MMSHPAVHPVDAPPPPSSPLNHGGGDGGAGGGGPRVRMKDLPGMPGTPGSLFLRGLQCLFATAAFLVMVTTSDFPTVSAFRFIVAATGLQIIWSFSLAMLDIYAILVQRSFRNCRAVTFFAVGDGITSTLTFGGACASAGITVLIDNDLNSCGKNHCVQFETSTSMAFMCWLAALPCFLLNFWSLAGSRR